MRRSLAVLLMTPALLLAPRIGAAEMPAGLDCQAPAVASALETGNAGEIRSLDAVERAELAASEPGRRGGDAILTIAVLAAIVALVWMYFQHVEHMNS